MVKDGLVVRALAFDSTIEPLSGFEFHVTVRVLFDIRGDKLFFFSFFFVGATATGGPPEVCIIEMIYLPTIYINCDTIIWAEKKD